MQNTRTRLCIFLACDTHTEQTQAQRATRFNVGKGRIQKHTCS